MAQVATDGVVYRPLTNAPKAAITLVRRNAPERAWRSRTSDRY
jgi:hypothetical protein